MKDIDCPFEGFHGFAVIPSKFGQGTSLLLENVHNRVDGMAIFELPCERVVYQLHPGLLLIALQGSVEEQLKPSTRRIAHRITQMEEVCLEVENMGCVRIGQTMEVWSRGTTVHTSGANTHSTAPTGPSNDKRQVLLGTRDLRSRSRNLTICPSAKYIRKTSNLLFVLFLCFFILFTEKVEKV